MSVETIIMAVLTVGAWAAFITSLMTLGKARELLREEREHRESIWRAVFLKEGKWPCLECGAPAAVQCGTVWFCAKHGDGCPHD